MIVRAPASTANLGPGFDALGLAVDLPFDVWVPDVAAGADAAGAAGADAAGDGADDAGAGVAGPVADVESGDVPPAGFLVAEENHPAAIAHRAAGGSGELWWRSPIPPGRGLGFSGAAAVAGAFAATRDREAAFEVAAEVEGHPDNAAPSTHGGFCVTAGDATIRLDPPTGVDLVVWWPATTTSTRRSRAALPEEVSFADAAFNVGRAALLVAAVAAGRLDAWDAGTRDRLHQDRRLELAPESADVLDRCREHGALGAWLSGSGPTVAALCAPETTGALLAALAGSGTARSLGLCDDGVRVVNPDQSGRL